MSSGEGPIGAAKGKQIEYRGLVPDPPPRGVIEGCQKERTGLSPTQAGLAEAVLAWP